ncbi:MAG TPA: 4-alpha-glucanotransferase, partial [Vicinamibacterales bacterium]|nr:4-alpha-glucanotransferase [Vicinamibacterales bacterium]
MSQRKAGVSVPLFSLRSTRGWGIGEMGDIPFMAGWLRTACQSVLQILPLNELAPSESSPYSALSAMAIDPQFISIWMMDEGQVFEDAWRREIDDVRRAPRIDYK